MGKLTDVKIKSAKAKSKPYKLADGDGMYVMVLPSGKKSFRHNYRFGGKEYTETFGLYRDVTLAEARGMVSKSRIWLREGRNPKLVRDGIKLAKRHSSAQTFEVVGAEWQREILSKKSAEYAKKMGAMLESRVYAYIGNQPIEEVKAAHLLQVFKRIEAEGKVDTAHRARSICGQIFRYAIATGRVEHDPTMALRGALAPRNVRHRPAITDPLQFGRLLLSLDAYDGTAVVSAALRLAPLVFLRPKELRMLEWSEIDLQQHRCVISAEVMKLRRPHIVPLSSQAEKILQELHPLTGRGRYVFPCTRGGGRAISDNALNSALVRMGIARDVHVPHGFRATARTMLDEQLRERVDLIEHQQARKVSDTMGRAYNRTQFIEERSEMMQRWADYLDGLKERAIKGTGLESITNAVTI